MQQKQAQKTMALAVVECEQTFRCHGFASGAPYCNIAYCKIGLPTNYLPNFCSFGLDKISASDIMGITEKCREIRGSIHI